MPKGGRRRGAGRKPRPTRLKELEGNPGKRPLNSREPRLEDSQLDPPRWLDETAKAEWMRLAPGLLACGLLTIADRTQLEAYCKAYSRWRQAEAIIEKSPTMMIKTEKDKFQKLPHVAIANRYLDQMRAIASEFGFTPASRSRLQVDPPPPPRQKSDGKEDQDFFGYTGDRPADRPGAHPVRGSA